MHLEHTAEALEATLAFGGHTSRCVFPWRTIFAIVDAHTGVGVAIETNEPKPEPRPAARPDDTKRLRMVKGGKA
jgi:stringent starvation protein B